MSATTLLFVCVVFTLLNGVFLLVFWWLVKKILVYQQIAYQKIEEIATRSPVSTTVEEISRIINAPQRAEHAAQRFSLTAQEEKVLRYLLEDLTYKEIAEKCCIAVHTVNSHVRHIYEKADVSTRRDLKFKIIARAA